MLVLLHSSYHSLTQVAPPSAVSHLLSLNPWAFLPVSLNPAESFAIYHITSSNILINTLNSVLLSVVFYPTWQFKQFSISQETTIEFSSFVPPQPILLEKKSYKTNWSPFTFVITYRLSPSGPLYKNCCRVVA